tara:strand:+ start:453 stop:761 length:309 start_codon:yes stop_codon:yes gene_type:complete
LIALDIGINYLNDPWGWFGLSQEDKNDLVAYWHIQHTANPQRWALSTPATIHDLFDVLATSRGKAPTGLFESSKTALGSSAQNRIMKNTGSTRDGLKFWGSD